MTTTMAIHGCNGDFDLVNKSHTLQLGTNDYDEIGLQRATERC